MYYKIENKECEVYKQLHELRTKELRINSENLEKINSRISLDWDKFSGSNSQQNWDRVKRYSGFGFTDKSVVDLSVWKEGKDGIFYPNKRTKAGRSVEEFLNKLETSSFKSVLDILNLEWLNKITFPYVEIVEDCIILFLGDNHIPKDLNIIEITSKEFEALRVS